MTDTYTSLVNAPVLGSVANALGLPKPIELDRYKEGAPLVDGAVLIGGAPGGRLGAPIAELLAAAETPVESEVDGPARGALADAGIDAGVWDRDNPKPQKFKGVIFDATGIKDSTELVELWGFFHPAIRIVAASGRIVVLGTPPEDCETPREATAQRALEGFVRAIAKEARYGATAQLVYVAPKAEDQLGSTLRFFLSPRSAYVSGQVARVSPADHSPEVDWAKPLHGKVALVTGASRGIGEAIAGVLARDGAHVVGLDIPPLADDLAKVMSGIGGSSLTADITADDAPKVIADHLEKEHGGVDIVVHNAGVTKDKTMAGMDEPRWTVLMEINLSSEERINDELLGRDLINENGRIICVSSISGISGNAGQTNYATSKAGVIGMVDAMAPILRKAGRGVTINAVAPGFIETQMTAAMPVGVREAGRRMNSMSQGGLPVDVGEAIAWYASPDSAGLNGNLVRVCGQSLIGA